MPYDLIIILFIAVGIIYGIYRGFYRELSHFIVLLVSFVLLLLLYDPIHHGLCSIINFDNFYNSLLPVLSIFNISQQYFELIICGMLVLLLFNLIANSFLFYFIFKEKRHKILVDAKPKRFLGALVGILSGFIMALIMLLIFNGLVELDITSPITSFCFKIPRYKELIDISLIRLG